MGRLTWASAGGLLCGADQSDPVRVSTREPATGIITASPRVSGVSST